MISSPRSPIVLSVLVGLVCPACIIDDIDLSGRRCPCPLEGWVCDTARDECVLASAGVDASMTDGGLDGGIDAGPPPPYCTTMPDAIFCEDFENGNLLRWDSVLPLDGGAPSSSPTSARTGAKGLRMTSSGSTPRGLVVSLDAPDVNELWFSAWVRVHDGATGTLDVFELSSNAGAITGQLVPASRAFVVRVAETGTTGVEGRSRDRRWDTSAWYCVQAHVVRGVNGSAEVFAVASQAAALTGVRTDFGAPYDRFSITLAAGSDVDLDDVVWTTRPAPCPLR